MKKLRILFILLIAGLFAKADGISVDAGLTPAQDRWIVRSQFRVMNMNTGSMNHRNINMPVVIAYGLTPDLTLMFRDNYLWKNVNTVDKKSGLNDPFVLAKLKLLRINKPGYSLGIAPAIGSNLPLGNPLVSSQVWSPEIGLNASFRPFYWSIDLNLKHSFNNVMVKSSTVASQTDGLNIALSRQLYLHPESPFALVPVVEYGISQTVARNELPENVIQVIAPGFQVIFPRFVIEGLYQTFYQSGAQIQNQFIFGIKMFL